MTRWSDDLEEGVSVEPWSRVMSVLAGRHRSETSRRPRLTLNRTSCPTKPFFVALSVQAVLREQQFYLRPIQDVLNMRADVGVANLVYVVRATRVLGRATCRGSLGRSDGFLFGGRNGRDRRIVGFGHVVRRVLGCRNNRQR